MQPKYRYAGIKRPAEELVSPLAFKAQRNDTAKSAHISARKLRANSESDSEPKAISSNLPTRHILEPRPQSNKRPAEDSELGSPLARKAQRNDTTKSAHISESAHKPPSFAISESDPEPIRHDYILKQHPQSKLPKKKYMQHYSESLTPVPKKSVLSSTSHTEQMPKNNESIRWPHKFKVYQIHNGFIQIRDTLKKATIQVVGPVEAVTPRCRVPSIQ
jgi:hypothetical protein